MCFFSSLFIPFQVKLKIFKQSISKVQQSKQRINFQAFVSHMLMSLSHIKLNDDDNEDDNEHTYSQTYRKTIKSSRKREEIYFQCTQIHGI